MKRGSTTGAAAKIEAWRRAGKELRDELVSTRDRLTVELQAAEAALAELDGAAAPPPAIAKAAKVARVKEPAVAFVAGTAEDGSKRRRGTGGVVHNGRSWKYKIGIDGAYRYGDTFPTQAEALAQLDAFLAARSPASAPAAPPKLAEKAEPKEDTGASPWLPMGPGWGKPDENGLAKHLSCNGRSCDGCKGNGYGRAKLRERKAA